MFTKKWQTILEEYEKVKRKESKHFKRVKDILSAYRVAKRDLYKYNHRWIEGDRQIETKEHPVEMMLSDIGVEKT